MGHSPSLTDYTKDTAQVLSGVIDQWLEQLKSQTNSSRRSVVLPISASSKNWIELHDLQARIPESYLDIKAESVGNSVASLLRKIDISCITANAQLARKLSSLAYETASFDVLIEETDTFEVSPWSLCIIASAANLFFLADHLGNVSKEKIQSTVKQASQLQKFVSTPLVLAKQFENELLPGDLWITDLLVRTVSKAIPKLIQAEPNAANKKLMQKALPALMAMLISTSLTQKLFFGNQLPSVLHPFIDFKRWSGLPTLIEHRGATSLRELISMESCRTISHNSPQQNYTALQNFSECISGLDSVDLLNRQRFIGTLLSDWLTIEQQLIEKFVSNPSGRSTFDTCIRLLEKSAEPTVNSALSKDVIELRGNLRQFPIYDQFRRLDEQLQAVGVPQFNIASDISE